MCTVQYVSCTVCMLHVCVHVRLNRYEICALNAAEISYCRVKWVVFF